MESIRIPSITNESHEPTLMIQNFPSSVFTASVCNPMTSLPACASEMAKQMNFLPCKTSGTTLA